MQYCRARNLPARGFDLKPGAFTHTVGDIHDPAAVEAALDGVKAVLHTATLHKPHVATHSRQAFVDTNISGTLTLLDACKRAGIPRFVFTSTTSAYGRALIPDANAPAAWITEDVTGLPKNIYGATKIAAEELCALAAYRDKMGVVILRTARFFPEEDDSPEVRAAFSDANAKANEFLYRRLDIEDAAQAHILAAEKAEALAFDRFILSAPTPFLPEDAEALRKNPAQVIETYHPGTEASYAELGWSLPSDISRVYDSRRAVARLGWKPGYDFPRVIQRALDGQDIASPLAQAVGVKGYHDQDFQDGPYPVEA